MRAALAAARAGHFVFPLWPRSKRPAIENWASVATRDPDAIRERWSLMPYNIGIACEPSKLYVIDLDDGHGHAPPADWAGARHGQDVLARLAAAAGATFPIRTYTVRTPPRGKHLYLHAPDDPPLRNTIGRLGWRVDTRGIGGYVVAAGSVRREGHYEVLDDAPIAPMPQWLATKLTPPPRPEPAVFVQRLPHTVSELSRIDAYVARVAGNVALAEIGRRHDTLNKAAFTLGRLVGGGDLIESDARATLHSAATCHVGIAGWTAAHAEKTISDGLAAGEKQPRSLAEASWSMVAPAGREPPSRSATTRAFSFPATAFTE